MPLDLHPTNPDENITVTTVQDLIDAISHIAKAQQWHAQEPIAGGGWHCGVIHFQPEIWIDEEIEDFNAYLESYTKGGWQLVTTNGKIDISLRVRNILTKKIEYRYVAGAGIKRCAVEGSLESILIEYRMTTNEKAFLEYEGMKRDVHRKHYEALKKVFGKEEAIAAAKDQLDKAEAMDEDQI